MRVIEAADNLHLASYEQDKNMVLVGEGYHHTSSLGENAYVNDE